MKNVTKGAIAVAAAAVLLTGGAGTLATWQASQNAGIADVAAGQLKLDLVANSSKWQDVTTATAKDITPAAFKIVPGDKVEFTTQALVTAQGNNLQGKLAIDAASITALKASWGGELDIAVKGASTSTPALVTTDNQNFTFNTLGDSAVHTYPVTVTVDVTFKDAVAPANNVAANMAKTVGLSTIGLTLTQTHN